MKIALIAPIIYSIPTKKYGATERLVHSLANHYVEMGHEVTLFASGDSQTKAKLVATVPEAISKLNIYQGRELFFVNAHTMLQVGEALARHKEFDVIHSHVGFPYIVMAAANLIDTPVVITNHDPFRPEHKDIYNRLRKPFIATISRSQASLAPYWFNHIGTIYNGADMRDYPLAAKRENYLLYVARVTPDKGAHNAIEIARRTGRKLIMAGMVHDYDRQYFEEQIKPEFDDQIEWLGEIDEQQRNELMSKAYCFLHPIEWDEPFGMSLIESMACGTPVIAYDRGAMREVIEDGKTGFVVKDLDQAIEAVSKIKKIDPLYCRTYALHKFNSRQMAEGYLWAFRKAIELSKNQKAGQAWSIKEFSAVRTG